MAVVLAWSLLLHGAPLCAASGAELDPSSESEARLPSLDITLVGESEDPDAVLDRVVSWFPPATTRHTARVATLEAEQIFGAQARPGVSIWIWLREPDAVRVFFRVREGSEPARYLVSDVHFDRGLDEVGLEELGQVVYSSAVALWAGNVRSTAEEVRSALAPTPAAAPVAKPVPALAAGRTHPAKSHLRLRLGAQYEFRWAGDEEAIHAPGASLAVLHAAAQHQLGAALHLGVLLPRHIQGGNVEIALAGAALSLRAYGAWAMKPGAWLAAELGPALDIVKFTPSSLEPQVVETETGELDWRPALSATIGARIDASDVTFVADASVTWQLLRVHYDEQTDARRSALLTPWSLQPGVTLGVLW